MGELMQMATHGSIVPYVVGLLIIIIAITVLKKAAGCVARVVTLLVLLAALAYLYSHFKGYL